MRTIQQCIDTLKEADKNTALTKNALRQMVLQGLLPSVKVGNKHLIAYENLEIYLKGNITPQEQPAGTIRRINERM